MGALILIPWPETTWSAAGRIAGRTPVPLTEVGQVQVARWAASLESSDLTTLYASSERSSAETAAILAKRVKAKCKSMAELVEVDVGLWGGLTTEELQRRYPKIFKRWCEDPSSVCPPEGEEWNDACQRLGRGLDAVSRRQGLRTVGMILGPLAFSVMRCLIESVPWKRVRAQDHDGPLRYPVIQASTPALVPARGDPSAEAFESVSSRPG